MRYLIVFSAAPFDVVEPGSPVSEYRKRRGAPLGPWASARAAAWLVAAGALLVGCADAQQRGAEEAVAARAGDAKISCTGAAKVGYLREIETETFFCLARHGASECDRYRVNVRKGVPVVRLLARRSDCVLPGS
jgi:hypothetical protein